MATQYGNDLSQRYPAQNDVDNKLVQGLGWFSIGLGVAELLAPGFVARLIGVGDGDESHPVMRMYGAREIAAGVGILTQSRPTGWLWARVGGDMLDLASIAGAMGSEEAERGRNLFGAIAVLGVTALDIYCASQLSRAAGWSRVAETGSAIAMKSMVISASPDEIYSFWRNFERLPEFMSRLNSVQMIGDRRSHWSYQGPGGRTVEWDAETVRDEPGRIIEWRSLPGSQVETSGRVTFENAPGGRGTIVRVEMEYNPPGGVMGVMAAKLFGVDPQWQLEADLRALKQIIETGAVVRSDASIHSGMHAAQPPYPGEQTQHAPNRWNTADSLTPSMA